MPSRAADIVNRMVDIIAYIDVQFDENGHANRRFITRRTANILAGSRLPYLDAIIPFGYDNLINAIGRAIDKQQEQDGIQVVDKKDRIQSEVLNFDEVRAEARDLWTKLTATDNEEHNAEMAQRISKRIEMIFGQPKKLSEITEDQVDLFNLVVVEMRDLLNS